MAARSSSNEHPKYRVPCSLQKSWSRCVRHAVSLEPRKSGLGLELKGSIASRRTWASSRAILPPLASFTCAAVGVVGPTWVFQKMCTVLTSKKVGQSSVSYPVVHVFPSCPYFCSLRFSSGPVVFLPFCLLLIVPFYLLSSPAILLCWVSLL